MSKIRLRIWPNGAFTATEHRPGEPVARVLEFDGKGRYHAVIVGDRNWSESEFRFDKNPPGKNPKFFLKQSKSESSGRILTTWQAGSRKGGNSEGQTMILANNSIRWSQETTSGSVVIKAQGDGFNSTR